MLPYARNLKQPSRELRSNMTDAEQLIWRHIRRKQIHGIQFYRQKPVGPFIVDFYAPSARLVIEIDGSQHYEVEHARKDAECDVSLASLGLRVLRFNNHQVLVETPSVLEEIFSVCCERLKNPPKSPFEKGDLNMLKNDNNQDIK